MIATQQSKFPDECMHGDETQNRDFATLPEATAPFFNSTSNVVDLDDNDSAHASFASMEGAIAEASNPCSQFGAGVLSLVGKRSHEVQEFLSRLRAQEMSLAYEQGKVKDFELNKLPIVAAKEVRSTKFGPCMNSKQAVERIREQASHSATQQCIKPSSSKDKLMRNSDKENTTHGGTVQPRLLKHIAQQQMRPNAAAQRPLNMRKQVRRNSFKLPSMLTTSKAVKDHLSIITEPDSFSGQASVAPTEPESPMSCADKFDSFLSNLVQNEPNLACADSDFQEALTQSKFELLEDLPFEEASESLKKDHSRATSKLRGMTETAKKVASNAAATSGFCSSPTATATATALFGNSSLAAACSGAGSQCKSEKACCSRQCVTCTSACQGRCGLGETRSNEDIQIFYYPWYASKPDDGFWRHWAADARPAGGVYDPSNDDIPANFYPRLGPYSSTRVEVLNKHMYWISRAGIGTIVVSWWGKGSFEDQLMRQILNAADDRGLKVAFYIEPYGGGYVRNEGGKTIGSRTPQTAMADVMYLTETYGCHRAIYRRNGRPVFMFFAARTYANGDPTEWKQVWNKLHASAKYNPFVVAHDVIVGRILAGDWDAGHDYGTAAAFKTSSGWETLASTYAAVGKTFYLTVSPGYDKSRMRDSNDPIISRQNGQLYKTFWERATAAKTNKNPVIITSFNEWHEGTQIEPAMPKNFPPYNYLGEQRDGYKYDDYEGAYGLTGEMAAFSYIDHTREYSTVYLKA
ncbi:hypothetical protein MPSEU_000836600 [Mayamaea pseudoterrestris]|nr:hypothetical protein MPSEU_000836600 [Mayamaea pseudoterrestris]